MSDAFVRSTWNSSKHRLISSSQATLEKPILFRAVLYSDRDCRYWPSSMSSYGCITEKSPAANLVFLRPMATQAILQGYNLFVEAQKHTIVQVDWIAHDDTLVKERRRTSSFFFLSAGSHAYPEKQCVGISECAVVTTRNDGDIGDCERCVFSVDCSMMSRFFRATCHCSE